jgi:aromatic-L-amino-acid decarboxylase
MSDEGARGLGDMAPEEFRAAAHKVADQVADYLEGVESYRVLPDVQPGDVRGQLPASPPAAPESFERIMEDYTRLIEPNITHWQHPGFMAYFTSVASGPGILGEWLASGLNSNVMFWKNAPASTELEDLVVSWLREMLGLPDLFDGMLTDTASISSLLSIVAARHMVEGLDAREEGLAGRPGLRRLRLYVSTETHSSVEKSAIVTGIGRAGVRRIPVDDKFRMRPDALEAAIAEDRRDGWQPFCVVATLGTTSSTSIDPAEALAEICEREKLWFHIDAAYGGTVALVPECRSLLRGWERADSLIINPHKWMMVPFDASLLLFRDAEIFRDALSIVPDYLRASQIPGVKNYNEYGIQMGRRFRALKLWMMIRYFGTEGFADRIREHRRLAQLFASWVDAEDGWERVAPVPFSTVCYRYQPAQFAGDEAAAERVDRLNLEILEEVNRSGQIYLSDTRLNGRITLRVTLGNPRATEEHVQRCWDLLRTAAATCLGRAGND